ncbi:MAG: hypothetical protein AB1601_04745 [Planctomycetota bacterium]
MGLAPGHRVRRADPVDLNKRVVASCLCIKCGTDLRGQSVEGACAVCRHSVYDSVYGGFLIDAPAPEIRRLYRMSHIVVYPAVLVAAITLFMLVSTLVLSRSVLHAIDSAFDVVLTGAMLAGIVALVGTVVFTGRHSAAYYLARYGRGLFLATIGVVAVVLIAAAVWFWGHFVECLVQVLFAAVPMAIFLHRLRHMMRMVPNKRLAAYASQVLVAVVAVAAAGLLVLVLRPQARPNTDWSAFLMVLTTLATLAGLWLGVATLRLVILARRTLWAIHDRPPEKPPPEADEIANGLENP